MKDQEHIMELRELWLNNGESYFNPTGGEGIIINNRTGGGSTRRMEDAPLEVIPMLDLSIVEHHAGSNPAPSKLTLQEEKRNETR